MIRSKENTTITSKEQPEYVIEFLKAVEKFIANNTNYKATYSGKRDYFVGHQFLKFPWKFVFVYKKDHQAEIFIESYVKIGTDKLRTLMDRFQKQMELDVGHPLEFVPGKRNKDLLRLMIRLDYRNSNNFKENLDDYVHVFLRFKNTLEKHFYI